MPTPNTPLSLLLDISALETQADISLRFKEIAEALLHGYYLRIEHQGSITDFELLEVEFYLQKQNVHEDPFCHAHEDQQKSAQWYFHRAPKRNAAPIKQSVAPTIAQGYRGGTRKGLDLTFGPPITSSFFHAKTSPFCRGGILLRTMRMRGGNAQIISGPSLLVDKILSITNCQNISELVTTKLGGYMSAFPPSQDSSAWNSHQSKMYLISHSREPNASDASIHRSPRIGLDLSHPSVSPQRNNSRVIFVAKLYRYFTHPDLLRANGRCHTLVGLYLEMAHGVSNGPFESKPALVEPISKIMVISRTTLDKYLDDFTEGFKHGSMTEFVGPSGKGISSSPKPFMKMMGVLGRMGLLALD